MTSLKLLFRPSRVEGKEGILYIRVIHDRVARQVNLGCKLRSREWKDGRVDTAAATDAPRRTYLEAVKRMISDSLSRLGAIIDRLEQSGEEYTSTRVVEAYRQTDDDEGKLCVFARKVADHLRRIGKVRLSETYTSSVNSFMRFRGENGDIPMTEMNSDLMKEYEHYLLDECGLNPNTGSFYMRNLRALYNRAVEKGLTTDRTPFRHVYTGVAKTMKRAVPAEVIRKIKGLDLTLQPALAQARDYFLLSFYLRGISFVDLSQLKTTDIQNGYLRYRRQKTGQQLEIKWEHQMQEIVCSHHREGSPYLLPLLDGVSGDPRRHYQNALQRVNAHLKKIGEMVNSPVALTTYTARHGWASMARRMDVPLSVISEAMGHDSEKTTRIYLNSLDSKRIDDANRMIINAI